MATLEDAQREVDELKRRIAEARPVELEKQLTLASRRVSELQELARLAAKATARSRRIKYLRELSVDDILINATFTMFLPIYVGNGCVHLGKVDDDAMRVCTCTAMYADVTEIYSQMNMSCDAIKRIVAERLTATMKTCDESAFNLSDDAVWFVKKEYNRVIAEVMQMDAGQKKAVIRVECDPKLIVRMWHEWSTIKNVTSGTKDGVVVVIFK